jgi:hypothetical protein
MALYTLINAASVPFFTPNTRVPPIPDSPIQPTPIAPQQTFQLTVTGSGAVSATVQPVVSNDGVNWSSYGDPFTATGTTKASQIAGGAQNWKFYSAYLTAISGTGAKATLILNG